MKFMTTPVPSSFHFLFAMPSTRKTVDLFGTKIKVPPTTFVHRIFAYDMTQAKRFAGDYARAHGLKLMQCVGVYA